MSSLAVYWWGDPGLNGRNLQRRCCHNSRMSQLEADRAEWNSFDTEFMGGQGSITSCSAIRGMDIY